MFTHYFKVGLGILLVLAVTIVGYFSLRGTVYNEDNSYRLHVVFDNVQGLSAGNDVWLSGVSIGSVESIGLNSEGRAVVTLRILTGKKILRDSRFTINTSPLQDKTLNIEKPADIITPYQYYEPDETITDTQSPSTIADLMSQAQNALVKINEILAEVKGVISDDDMQANIYRTTENIEKATEEAYSFAKMLNETGIANRDDIERTIENIRLLTESLNKTAEKVDVLVSNANDIVGDEETKREIKEIVESLKISMDNIEKTTEAIKVITTDEEIQQDVRETIKSTKATMEHADKAVSGFTKMLESINDTEFKPDFEFRYEAREDLYHADMNVRIFPPKSKVFYLFGYDNLGEDKATNLMFGVSGDQPDLWYRFGLKNSTLSIGFEFEKEDLFYYGFLSDPNDLELSLRVGRELNENQYLIAGWEGAFKRDSLSFGFMQRY